MNFLKKLLALLIYVVPITIFLVLNLDNLEGSHYQWWHAILTTLIFVGAIPVFNRLVIYKDKAYLKLHAIAVLSGALLALAWPPLPLAPVIFIAWLPLLWVEKQISDPQSQYYGYRIYPLAYTSMITWNLLTTFWVANSHLVGGLIAFTANSALMALPWLAFHITKKYLGKYLGYISLIVYYLCFEYLHMAWELTWPWLTLGNVFAKFPEWVQWYEFTGHVGGSLWILFVNVFLFNIPVIINNLQHYLRHRFRSMSLERATKLAKRLTIATAVSIVFVPVLISATIYFTYKEVGQPVNVTVVQPNLDPYAEKFDLPDQEVLKRFLELSSKGMTDSTDFLVWPETGIPGLVRLDHPTTNYEFYKTAQFLEDFPRASLIAGVYGMRNYDTPETVTARYYGDGKCCYDVFNGAILMDSSKRYPVYLKSKLVPGVERMPYPGLFKFLGDFALELGGTSGSFGTQKERTPLFNSDSVGIGVAICYESVFGDYVTHYIRNGAQAIFIITNDAWWGNTAGYKQHLSYASLRAIETRKDIARSANTGISCFINQRGNIRQATKYDTPDVISSTILVNKVQTFFVRYGDFTGRIATFLSIFFVLTTFVRSRTRKTLV